MPGNFNLSGQRALVTGGAGFLGTNLVRRLLNEGAVVAALDNYHTGRPGNLLPLQQQFGDRLTVIEGNVQQLPGGLEPDLIFNLACPASPPHYQADPIGTTKTCVLGALQVLDLAYRRNARVLQCSTSEIYGDPLVHPQPETYWGQVNCTGIRACYDEGKRCAESLFFDYRRLYGTRIKVIRIFNTYGPGMQPDDGRVVSNFILQALQNEPITIYGDGSQTRSFCYVDDLIEAMLRMMFSPEEFAGPVNLGNPGEFTILELAKKILRLTASKSVIEHRPLPSNDPRQRRPDISLAKARLGWAPRVPLDQGLPPTIAYFQNLLRTRGALHPNHTKQ